MIDTNSDMRFMANNFLETGYNSLDVSSVASGYSKLDLFSHERSRTFMFGGRFTIDATNNKMYIDGVTYTIPSGEMSGAALAASIESVIPQTVTYNDNSFTISGASFTLNMSNTTNSIWEAIGLIDGVDLTNTEFNSDMPRFHWPNETITLDIGYQAAIGFVGLAGDLTREFRIPEGAVVRLQANTVNDFTTPPVDKNLTWTKRGVFGFIDDNADDAWRYCKLTITAPEGPFHSEIGYLYIGDYESFVDRNINVGVEINFVDTSSSSESDDGQEYTNEKTPYRMFRGLSVGLANPVNVNFLKRLFYLKLKSSPFFVSLDPKVAISETIDDMTALCRFSREPSSKHVLYNKYELSFELKEAL